MASPALKRKGPPALSVNLVKEESQSESHADQLEAVISQLNKMNLAESDFEDIGELGAGSEGVVKKSKHNPTGTIMAKKIISMSTTAEEQKNLLRELKFLKDFNSPNIVSFYGAFMTPQVIYICMEYMDVGSFDDIYRKVTTVPEEVLGKVACAVIDALVYMLNKYKIIHRDLKPSNMLLNSRGQVKICDFGVSGVLLNTVAVAETFVGTSFYMSPARIQGQKYSASSDTWSLGLSLFEMAIGRFPIDFDKGGAQKKQKLGVFDLLSVIVKGSAPRLSSEDFSSEFVDFIDKCLVKEDDKRSTPTDLQKHAFITKSRSQKVDMSGWAHRVLEL